MKLRSTFISLLRTQWENALRWHNKIEISINKLDTFPDRCPVAEEDQYFDFKVRQLVIGNYRALFRIKISGISADEAATIASSSEGAWPAINEVRRKVVWPVMRWVGVSTLRLWRVGLQIFCCGKDVFVSTPSQTFVIQFGRILPCVVKLWVSNPDIAWIHENLA